MVKYSIITVCLNSESTIERCLTSVKNQKVANYEHIVIDGLSTDSTLAIVEKYNVNQCISEKDAGIYDAMNKGALLAKGSYVLFLNSDDELEPNYLLECEMKMKNEDFISVGIQMISDGKSNKWMPKGNLNKNSFFWRMPLPHPGLMVKREIFKELNGFDTQFKIAADYDFIVRLLKGGYSGTFIYQPLVRFYLGGVSDNRKILFENNGVRLKNYDNKFLIFFAYLLDQLRWIMN